MSKHFHAVVWIDHREAKVFSFNREEADKVVLHPDHPTKHIHHRSGSASGTHSKMEHSFLHEIAHELQGCGAILVTGPGNAKVELMSHFKSHDPAVAKCVSAVETVDHPSDGQLLALARKHFKSADKATPQM